MKRDRESGTERDGGLNTTAGLKETAGLKVTAGLKTRAYNCRAHLQMRLSASAERESPAQRSGYGVRSRICATTGK